jgi:hypothetical protein
MFAADLYEVIMQNGKRPIYEDPEKFFSLTFPTYNLRKLVKDVVLRVAGKNDKAVRQLELTYGGGKTHTLITLRHLVEESVTLPKLPAVDEFVVEIGQTPPKARVAALCFDKLDVEKGMEVRSPDGSVRLLKQPWSVLAYQLAGDDGLKILHAENKAEERESAPAENLMTELLELPIKDGLGVLILIDEVLMYVREKVAMDKTWRDRMINFFQYLTQAATKVDRCCIVASLLASDPKKTDNFGRELQGELYDIFMRQREEAVEPVSKDDVAEVLRRRFFTTESTKDRESYRQHVQAALKGICAIDEQTVKQGAEAEERFHKSYPFHPDMTEVFYTKWTQLDRFQRTRGVLRTFALALREAELWDLSPLVGPAVFLTETGTDGLSEGLRELITVADTQDHEGKKQAWTGIIEGELARARDIQRDMVGLGFREIEQAVIGTFLHSQPTGHHAHTRDLIVMLGATRPDKIELEKGLIRWAQMSHWLEDQYSEIATSDNLLPGSWRLGDRPNLNQMHDVAAKHISSDIVRARLLDEIGKLKTLSAGASAAGVRVHTLPAKPRDIEDDGLFHYAILGPSAASESGKPSAEAKKYLDETTGPEKPRVYRNALLLLAPTKDGLEVASLRVREYLGWEQVLSDLKEQQKDGTVDIARMHTLTINIDKGKGRIPESIRQAYCTVVTVSDKNEVQAFKINVSDDPHFTIIKNDARSRVQESQVSADALLPDGPYNLWHAGETSRRVKDLYGAFAQMPHLPKMLQAKAILDTLVDGCVQGAFVLRLTRPDGTFRTWWRSRPDDNAMNDAALELVLPEAAELTDIPHKLLVQGTLPELWQGEEITVQAILDYFSGSTVIQIQRDGYSEPVAIPKASKDVVNTAVGTSVESGYLWLLNSPASILAEPIPAGILGPNATLRQPPPAIAAFDILPENLPDAWSNDKATALSVATALSQKYGVNQPWKTVKDVVTTAINARFLELDKAGGEWPCDYPAAQTIILKVTLSGNKEDIKEEHEKWQTHRHAQSKLEPAEIQELGDMIPQLLDLKNKTNVPFTVTVYIELGDGENMPSDSVVQEFNKVLSNVREELNFKLGNVS